MSGAAGRITLAVIAGCLIFAPEKAAADWPYVDPSTDSPCELIEIIRDDPIADWRTPSTAGEVRVWLD